MTYIDDTFDGDLAEHVRFPSPESGGRLLCLSGNYSDAKKNSYALSFPDALPFGATLLSGLTFISDSFYDYTNLWHGLGAIVPFISLNERPARWILYQRGALRKKMSPWVRSVVEASTGEEVRIERLESQRCFEEAILFRVNEGHMSRDRKLKAFNTIRCKARAFCNITGLTDPTVVSVTLLMRTGTRSFKNESAVIDVFRKACNAECTLTVAWASKMDSFCEQVRVASMTDVLASPHGAQLTNMIFMQRNSSVMEFFPGGWKEGAGAGQFVYHWQAAKSGIMHRGAWRDTKGVDCELPKEERKRCFSLFYKDQSIGHDEDYFLGWAMAVIAQAREMKLRRVSDPRLYNGCP